MRAEQLSVSEDLRLFRLSLLASFELTFTKGVVGKYSENPRSSKIACGVLTTTLPVCDAAWGLIHEKIDTSSCVWLSKGRHRSGKPLYKDPRASFTPSRLKYAFHTTVALHRIIAWDRLCVEARSGDIGDNVCPLPKGWVHEDAKFVMIGAAVLDSVSFEPPPRPDRIRGESGIVIGRRCCTSVLVFTC